MVQSIDTLTLDDARKMVAAGEDKAREIGVPYNLAVVDAGGDLLLLVRMDGAWRGSVDIAINKAWTSRAFDMPTAKLSGMSQSGQPLFGIHATNDERVVVFGGGVPIESGGKIIGAVGASGGTVDQDVEIVTAAASAFL
ncbi:MAG: heme-binding protein [Pseudomonadota bacterium]|nr:heme-binding protein [Pseudomonadota bacterium]